MATARPPLLKRLCPDGHAYDVAREDAPALCPQCGYTHGFCQFATDKARDDYQAGRRKDTSWHTKGT
jgi:hypothetical protein